MNSENNVETTDNEENVKPAIRNPRLNAVIPIILFSYLGVSVRLALSLLGNTRSPLNASLWPNVLGCFIMGLVVEQKTQLQQQ